MKKTHTSDKHKKNKKLGSYIDSISWGLFFVMLGSFLLLRDYRFTLPDQTWLFGAGIILLGANVARLLLNIKIQPLSVIIGVIALSIGMADVFGYEMVSLLPIIFIVAGGAIILNVLAQIRHK